MIYENYLGGVLIHYGVKGMKWGVRRTPEQLGHVAKAAKAVKIVDGVYQSSKGFAVKQSKFSEWCLKPGTDHSDEFFGVGYKPTDSDRLFRDMEKCFDLSKKRDAMSVGKTKEKFSIPMSLGVTAKRLFRTVWQKDGPDEAARFVTAYIDRRLEED